MGKVLGQKCWGRGEKREGGWAMWVQGEAEVKAGISVRGGGLGKAAMQGTKGRMGLGTWGRVETSGGLEHGAGA